MAWTIGWGGLALLLVVLAVASLRILREYERGVVFLLGRFWRVKGPGLVVLVPLVQQMVRVDLRTVVMDVPSQDVISRDNVSVKVNAVIYFRVVDPQRAIIQVANYFDATSQLAQTTLRSVLGERRVAPMFAPGTHFDYCNVCYNVLAVVAERVTGERYEALLRERIWRPAGIADAYVRPAKLDALPPGRAVGHRWRDGRDEPRDAEDNEGFHGGSNVYASARGFARFVAALAGGAAWLGPAAADAVEPVRLADGATTGITLGGWFCAPGGQRCYFNGHHQGFFAVMYWDRGRRLAVAWVSNSTMPLSLRNALTRGLVAAAEGRPVAVSPVQAVPLDAAKLAALAGDHEVGGIGRVRVAIDGKRGTLRTAGVDYELFRVSPAAYYAPGVDALLGATADGRLTWSSVFVQAVGTPVR